MADFIFRNNINKAVNHLTNLIFLASRYKDSIFQVGVFQLVLVIQTLFNIVKSAFKFPIAAHNASQISPAKIVAATRYRQFHPSVSSEWHQPNLV